MFLGLQTLVGGGGGNFNRQLKEVCQFDIRNHTLKFIDFWENDTPKFTGNSKYVPKSCDNKILTKYVKFDQNQCPKKLSFLSGI